MCYHSPELTIMKGVNMSHNLGEKYNPLYFLAALGAGGLSVSFFMYINFMIPRKGPMITFEQWYPVLLQGNAQSALIVASLLGIVFFAFYHIKLLLWNIKEYKLFKTTEAYQKLKSTNAEVTLMTMPLTFAMTVNVMFVIGAVFVPGLWDVVEYLFPGALVAFGIIGYYGIKIFGEYFQRLIVKGDFDFIQNSNLSQMISVFAFSMIDVGFAAPAAMSHVPATMAIGAMLSFLFGTLVVVLAFIKLLLGFKSILRNGISLEAAPSLWIAIPIITLIGITIFRDMAGLTHHNLNWHLVFAYTGGLVSLQLIFGYIGYKVLKEMGYFEKFVNGDGKSVGSFALICPGVAFFVFGQFFLYYGLYFGPKHEGFIDQFSIAYFVLLAPFVYVQFVTIVTFFKLKAKFF